MSTHDWDKPSHWNGYTPTFEGSREYLMGNDEALTVHRSYYRGEYCMGPWQFRSVLSKGQETLLKRDHERLEVVRHEFPLSLTMCPYHPKLLPHYQYFAETVKNTDGLEVLKIVNHHLPNEGYFLTELMPAIGSKENLKTLELSNCGLTGSDLTAIISYLAENETLHAINFSGNCFDLDATVALAGAIRNHPILYEIDLSGCNLGDGDVGALGKLLVACKDCDVLALGHGSFSAEGIALISKFLGKKISISTFRLSNVSVKKEGKGLLTNALKKNKSITDLSICSCGKLPAIIDKNDLRSLHLHRLTSLNLSRNGLPAGCAKILADFLSANSSLVALNLSSNRMSTKSANVIIPVLKENTTLQHLDLSRNSLSKPKSISVLCTQFILMVTNLITRRFGLAGCSGFAKGKFDAPDARHFWQQIYENKVIRISVHPSWMGLAQR